MKKKMLYLTLRKDNINICLPIDSSNLNKCWWIPGNKMSIKYSIAY